MKEIILKQIKQFLSLEGNEIGGNLHIVLDDGNLENENIAWCMHLCINKQDFLGFSICDNLLRITYKEREAIYNEL